MSSMPIFPDQPRPEFTKYYYYPRGVEGYALSPCIAIIPANGQVKIMRRKEFRLENDDNKVVDIIRDAPWLNPDGSLILNPNKSKYYGESN